MSKHTIVLTCDDRYVRHSAATIASIVLNSDKQFEFYIIDCGISSDNLLKLKSMELVKENDCDIFIIKAPKNELFENFSMAPWFSPSIFYRVCIPELLNDKETVLYLDSDIIVTGDIYEIFEHNIENYLFGAVYLDDNFIKKEQFYSYKSRIGIPLVNKYFYSGLMLMNLNKMRAAHVFDNVLKFLQNNPNKQLLCPEQDILNIIINRKDILELEPKYNFTPFSPLSKKTLKKCKPICLHFSVYKPWEFPRNIIKYFHFSYIFRCAAIYHFYAQKTPWNNDKYNNASLRKALKAIYKSFTQPIERFFRFEVRDKIKNWLRKK